MIRVLALLALASCAGALRTTNRVGLGAAVAMLACDWSQTRRQASDGWRGEHESNPVIGARPSPLAVDAYMFGSTVALVALWRVIPERVRPFLWTPVLVVETDSVTYNQRNTVPGFCGLGGT